MHEPDEHDESPFRFLNPSGRITLGYFSLWDR